MTDRLSQRLIDKVPSPSLSTELELSDVDHRITTYAFAGLQSASIADLVAAKAKADITLRNVRKGKKNPFFNSDYADLDAITRVVRPIYGEHGLAVVQAPWIVDGRDILVTTLAHESGQWCRSMLPIAAMPDKSGVVTPQAVGSAITYAKRYALAAMANIAQTDEDDDGEAAMGRPAARPAEPQEEHVAPFDLDDFGDKPGLPDIESAEDIGLEERLKRSLEACKTKADLKRWDDEHIATFSQMDPAATERLRAVYGRTKDKLRA
tara:strand:+ start:1053 stop:1847 length:795 start_codon:yes stop_codon:yes gene_type:complete